MKSKSLSVPRPIQVSLLRSVNMRLIRYACLSLIVVSGFCGTQISLAATPAWMREQVNAPVPAHDDKANAALMYAETVLTVLPNGSIKRLQRYAYKILRPDGEQYGLVRVDFDSQSRILALRAWCIPTSGKDYEVKEKEAIESALIGAQNGELMNDTHSKLLRIPAATPGSIVGYEVEQEHRPYQLADEWDFQDTIPVREARYGLQLPKGWSYKSTWINHAEATPQASDAGRVQWTVNDVKPIRIEDNMPPWRGIAGRMVVTLVPPDGKETGMQSWSDIGDWYLNLAKDRRAASPEIKKRVAELTATVPTTLAKVQALANFVQNDVRYVAIELGIGGWQPHAATDVFNLRFGDCKDKATLLGVMLREIGVDSHPVIINTERGSVSPTTPPHMFFNHMVIAVSLPADTDNTTLLARITHPKFGQLVFFDPTDTLTPFGRLGGALQSNYGIVVKPASSELILLPKLPITSNGINRTAQMTLDEKGTLTGEIHESRVGDPAAAQRSLVRSITEATSQIKPVEALAAASFTQFDIVEAKIGNLRSDNLPFEWHYKIEAAKYAKVAGDMLLVRPRVIGSKATGFLETKEARVHPVEFDRPQRDKDVFEITLPNGYVVDEVPPPLKLDEGFIAYESKTEVVGRKLRFTRTFEVKDLSAPAASAEKLKLFYRAILSDERNVAVLKRAGT